MALERRGPLRSVSAKRAAELAERGVTWIGSTLARSGPIERGEGWVLRARPLERVGFPVERAAAKPTPKKPRVGGATGLPREALDPTPETAQIVWLRDGGRCVCCGVRLVWEQRGWPFGWSLHHRKDKSLSRDNGPGNLVLLAGSGSTRCHGLATEDPAPFRPRGIVLRSWQDPLSVPLVAWDGIWHLANDGTRLAAA